MSSKRPSSIRTFGFRSSRHLPQSPPSPTFSDATNASAMNFGADGPAKIITRANLKVGQQAYEDLMNTSANYRAALVNASKAAAAFGDAMGNCSGLKGPSYEAGTRLQAASGLHHLIGNHWHVLADTLDRKFEKPLRSHFENYRTVVTERSNTYERALREKSQLIRETELKSMNKKSRNLQSFREALSTLQRQVADLDDLKAVHYQEILEHEEEVWDAVQNKVCLVVRSTMDVFDRFTAKASDPVIEAMLQAIPDPFDSYGPPPAEDQIFSILPPLSILSVPSSAPSPSSRHADLDSVDGFPSRSVSRNNSWTGDGIAFPASSESSPSSPRSASPSSPPFLPQRSYSTPSSSTPLPKKLDSSKLRSMVTSVEETHLFNAANHSYDSLPGVNGGTIRASKAEKSPVITNFSWKSSFPIVFNGHDEDLPTPRNATFFPISQPHSTPPSPRSRSDSDSQNSQNTEMDSDRKSITIPVAG